jgi:hypothetical protein
MESLKVKDTEIMTEYGFFVVQTECGQSLNICLEQRADGNGYKKVIEGDGGYDWGGCGDANAEAIEKYGNDAVLEFILKAARKAGIKTQ